MTLLLGLLACARNDPASHTSPAGHHARQRATGIGDLPSPLLVPGPKSSWGALAHTSLKYDEMHLGGCSINTDAGAGCFFPWEGFSPLHKMTHQRQQLGMLPARNVALRDHHNMTQTPTWPCAIAQCTMRQRDHPTCLRSVPMHTTRRCVGLFLCDGISLCRVVT